jgi:hypothetical protein
MGAVPGVQELVEDFARQDAAEHDVVSSASESRKSSAEANATATKPIDLNRLVAASRTDGSSSTIVMQGS